MISEVSFTRPYSSDSVLVALGGSTGSVLPDGADAHEANREETFASCAKQGLPRIAAIRRELKEGFCQFCPETQGSL